MCLLAKVKRGLAFDQIDQECYGSAKDLRNLPKMSSQTNFDKKTYFSMIRLMIFRIIYNIPKAKLLLVSLGL